MRAGPVRVVFRNLFFFALLGLAGGVLAADPPRLHPALQISLWASEPDVVDPVALTWDERGRMYVVEMRDYPLGIGADQRPGGTVRLLEDTDGDGRSDRSVLFADNLSFPTSVAAWNGGIFVTAPPEIIYLKDLDGDGKADLREVFFSGFLLGVTDSNVNGLRWGLDNRLHGVNGGNGGAVVSRLKPGPPINIRNLDFSFDPRSGDFSPTFHTSGGFGLVFDEWGRSFVTYNLNHLQQRMIPVRYLERFPGLLPVSGTESISDHGEMARIYPLSEAETRVNHPEQSGFFSSAGGMGYLGSRQYPGDLFGSLFVCDVVGNLVHRDILAPNGPGFIAKRAPGEEKQEFFASRDPACRPVGLEIGPDAALYLIDMQRDVIEHPDYIPQKVREKLDLRAGEDRGRIYRISPKGGLPFRPANLAGESSTALVRHLTDPNPWWRQTAQRLLIERQDKSSIPGLQQLAGNRRESLGRLHALWSLHGLQALDPSLVQAALSDPTGKPALRETALLLGETIGHHFKPFEKSLLKLADDANPRVRFQAALTLGDFDLPGASQALLKVLRRDHSWRWSRLAVWSSLGGDEVEFLRGLLRERDFREAPTASRLEALRELGTLIGGRAAADRCANLAAAVHFVAGEKLNSASTLAVLQGIEAGLRMAPAECRNPALAIDLERLGQDRSIALLVAGWRLARTLGIPDRPGQTAALRAAQSRVLDRRRALAQRLEDVQLIGLGTASGAGPILLELLDGTEPSALQQAAFQALSLLLDRRAAQGIIDRWPGLAPAVKGDAVNLLLRRGPFQDILLTALEQGKLSVGELNLDLEQRRRLLRQASPEIQARAARWISDEEYSNRKAVVNVWLEKLPQTGDSSRGRVVFEKTCASCHVLDGVGHPVGPDLAAMAHRSAEDLVSNILDPNMAIAPNYFSYFAEQTNGDLETGILSGESAEAITLLQPGGGKKVIPRSRLRQLRSSGISLMPEGLEGGMSPGDLRDLVEYLKAPR